MAGQITVVITESATGKVLSTSEWDLNQVRYMHPFISRWLRYHTDDRTSVATYPDGSVKVRGVPLPAKPETFPRSEITHHEPIREGNGSSRTWSRTIRGKLYSFEAVFMPNGERRYFASRLQDGKDSRFACYWTRVFALTLPDEPIIIDMRNGGAFDHACRGAWLVQGKNATGHSIFKCDRDSRPHILIEYHVVKTHVCTDECASTVIVPDETGRMIHALDALPDHSDRPGYRTYLQMFISGILSAGDIGEYYQAKIAPPYAWVILRDHICESLPGHLDPSLQEDCIGMCGKRPMSECSATVTGPRGITPDMIALATDTGRWFRMYDDDDLIYYTGRLWINPSRSGEVDEFEPLDDFGRPNAGCTRIDYRTDSGKWETL